MKQNNRIRLLSLLILLICGGLFVGLVLAIHTGAIEGFDLPIIHFVQGFEAGWLTIVFKTFTWIGSGYGVTPITLVICSLLFFKYNKRPQALFFAFAIVSTILLNELLKRVFTRARPELYRLMDAGGFSFPSGHTMMAVSLYAMIVYVLWSAVKSRASRTVLVLVSSLIALTIAVSRIYVGVHFPSDIVGGILVSTMWLTLLFIGSSVVKQRLNL